MHEKRESRVICELDVIHEPDFKKYEFLGFCVIIGLLILIIVLIEITRLF